MQYPNSCEINVYVFVKCWRNRMSKGDVEIRAKKKEKKKKENAGKMQKL